MSKHTPGPWSCFVPFKGRYPIVQRGKSGGFQVIAVNKDLALADANLIAAAPELLAALYEALPFINDDDGAYKNGYAKKVERRILAAIDKAEGKV